MCSRPASRQKSPNGPASRGLPRTICRSALLEAACRQFELSGWSLERLHSKARITITAGIAALSVTTVGLEGPAALPAKDALNRVTPPKPPFGWLAHQMIAAAMDGIAADLLPVIALKGCQPHQMPALGEFELVTMGESRKMSKGVLGEVREHHQDVQSRH